MRSFLIILLLCSIASQQLVIYTDWLSAVDVSLVENSKEAQSESENQEKIKDKTKIDYISMDLSSMGWYDLMFKSGNEAIALYRQKPYLEIHSPPPE